MKELQLLSDRRAVVVGGARGIGGSITECLAAHGAKTTALYCGAGPAAADLRARGGSGGWLRGRTAGGRQGNGPLPRVP